MTPEIQFNQAQEGRAEQLSLVYHGDPRRKLRMEKGF